MKVARIPVGPFEANCWLVAEPGAGALVVDPGADAPSILAALRDAGEPLRAVLLTHGHLDHLSALPPLLAAQPAPVPVRLAAADAAWCFTSLNDIPPYEPVLEPPASLEPVEDGGEIPLGSLRLRVLATPGHSPGSVCFFADADGSRPPVLFSGDTLFRASVGRTDLPGGSWDELAASLRRLAALPPETRVLPGHGRPTTVAAERELNPFLAQPD
ncbi:MAG: MBL fold metallo-hydrolase [Kiritimatiellae bacterium]|nr:MBL fold metallo-hydrolase [Kiritimatiellia bacterium]